MQATEEFLSEWAAAERAGDAGTLETLLADGFTAVGPMGFILPKEAWLARHRSGDLIYQEFGLDDVQARPLGPNTTVVIARSDSLGSYQGHQLPGAARATLVLASSEGRWQLAAIHLSFIAGTVGAPPIPGPR
jgi:hypothetical protein